MNLRLPVCILTASLLLGSNASAQHLWWNLENQKAATCLYGEITVLATSPGIYYCGANWHPGEPAGGYCGIQHNAPKERRTIFSVWDTSPTLHPATTEADPQTLHNRFGGEGEGGHTHMLWDWKEGQTFKFFVQKRPAASPENIDARYYIYDAPKKHWRHAATITSPAGGAKSVATLGGGLNSFLENFTGQDRNAPKIALYRLWLGTDVEKMQCLTRAIGDGIWGQLHDAYFLAEGDREKLNAEFAEVEKEYGKPAFAEKDKQLQPITDTPLPKELVESLKHLPQADKVKAERRASP